MTNLETKKAQLNKSFWEDQYKSDLIGPGDVYEQYPKRNPDSHKGQNGHILIIGGSKKYHGAPLINYQGASAIGIDLATIFVPQIHEAVTKNFSSDFFVQTFKNNHLSINDIEPILEATEEADVCIIGGGLEKQNKTEKAVIEILERTSIPCIIDADAILPNNKYYRIPDNSIFTPHKIEAQRLYGEAIPEKLSNFTILKKGPVDQITLNQTIKYNKTGTAILTKGGTGDFLAGMCGALLARQTDSFSAAALSSFLIGYSDEMAQGIYGDSYSFEKLAETISWVTKNILSGEEIKPLHKTNL